MTLTITDLAALTAIIATQITALGVVIRYYVKAEINASRSLIDTKVNAAVADLKLAAEEKYTRQRHDISESMRKWVHDEVVVDLAKLEQKVDRHGERLDRHGERLIMLEKK